MDKKLPSVFANKIEKNINNNSNYYVSENREILDDNININQKINNIFNSSNFVYKANVIIKYSNKEEFHEIIGRNSLNLITMDNKLIPISEIVDIKKAE